ncbi:MAG: YhfC family intramembrane metalloprotease [Agathobacter sp.]
MNYGTVSTGGFAGLIFMLIWGIALPVVAAIIWRVKTRANLLPVLVGAIIFPLFALGLESIPKYFLLANGSDLAQYITTHLWSYALVGAGLAGIFEETGRWVAFRFILKKHTDKKTAITYGIGHGGIEAVILLSVGAFQYITYAMMINQGVFGTIVEQVRMVSPDQVEAVEAIAVALTSLTFGNSLIGCVERVFAMILHISCSVLVFKSVREKKWYFFVLAVVLHGLLDVFACLYQFGVITSIWMVEGLIGVFSIGVGILACKVYKGMKAE